MMHPWRDRVKLVFPVFSILWMVLVVSPVWAAQDEKADDDEFHGVEAKGNQDLQMIARQMEFLSGRLNRMPSPPKMDATLMINPGDGYVSKQGGKGTNEENNEFHQEQPSE
jgi:hypothetical protein